jgi:hypothetical protein
VASPIRSREQVPERPPCQVGHSPAPHVLIAIVQAVTTLAEGGKVASVVIGRVLVAVRRREDDAGRAGAFQEAVGRPQAADPLAGPVTPPTSSFVPLAAIPEVHDHAPLRSTASLAPALGMAVSERGQY